MSETQPKAPVARRKEEHRCTCGARFEVGHYGDPLLTLVSVDVKCPACGKSHTVSVPRGTEGNLTVERAAGLEPETGGSG